jgi:hypothetical protein
MNSRDEETRNITGVGVGMIGFSGLDLAVADRRLDYGDGVGTVHPIAATSNFRQRGHLRT